MCGRYATTRTGPELERDFLAKLGELYVDTGPDHNVAPTDLVPLVIGRPTSTGVEREIASGHWGLKPPWGRTGGFINARSETVEDKPAFRSAYRSRRSIVPMDGYYEWSRSPSGVKQPYFFTRPQGLAVAGLHEFHRGDDGVWSITFTILTGPATGVATSIHDRTPLLVPTEYAEEWLTPEPVPNAIDMLMPATSASELEIRPVSTLVNSVRENGPELTRPMSAEQLELTWGE